MKVGSAKRVLKMLTKPSSSATASRFPSPLICRKWPYNHVIITTPCTSKTQPWASHSASCGVALLGGGLEGEYRTFPRYSFTFNWIIWTLSLEQTDGWISNISQTMTTVSTFSHLHNKNQKYR